MTPAFLRPLVLAVLIGTTFASALPLKAEDPLVFISSFAGDGKGAITALRFSLTDGTLEAVNRTRDIENPFFLAVSPDQGFLYAIHAKDFGGDENEEVAAYRIDPDTGRLTLLNRQSAKGSGSCSLAVDATGKTVLVANYYSGSVAALPVKADGSLGEAASFFQHQGGSGVDPKRQNGPFAHSFIVSPDNRYAYAADLGLDQVLVYRFDAATAILTPSSPPFVNSPPGAGPRHLAFHPKGKHLYAIDELSNTITRYDYAADTGILIRKESVPTLPEEFKGTSYCADLKITPDGKFLYGTNRGHDSIASYRIGEDGALARIGIVPSLGKGPQNLLITPDGKWLLCANMPGNSIAVFRIDAATGALQVVGTQMEITSPSCLRLIP